MKKQQKEVLKTFKYKVTKYSLFFNKENASLSFYIGMNQNNANFKNSLMTILKMFCKLIICSQK